MALAESKAGSAAQGRLQALDASFLLSARISVSPVRWQDNSNIVPEQRNLQLVLHLTAGVVAAPGALPPKKALQCVLEAHAAHKCAACAFPVQLPYES
jgi:hypothetical protein